MYISRKDKTGIVAFKQYLSLMNKYNWVEKILKFNNKIINTISKSYTGDLILKYINHNYILIISKILWN